METKIKMQNDIMESIKKNLPEQVAGELKSVLEEYGRLKKVEKDRDDITAKYCSIAEELEKLNKILDGYRSREKELADREKAVQERENKAEINELKILLKASDASNEKVMGFVDALMRNTIFRKKSMPHVEWSNNYTTNGYQSTTPVRTGEDTETTVE